jgi:hypothetical protein
LYCDVKKSSSPFFVRGSIQRIALNNSIQQQLKQAQLAEYQIYIEHQIWYDAIDSLARLRSKNPTDATLQTAWQNLLDANGINIQIDSTVSFAGDIQQILTNN